MSESKLQSECIRWVKYQYPHLIVFSIPNGGTRNIREAVRLKAEGVMAGVSDLFVARPSGRSAGLFIEMKVKPNKMTGNQEIFARRIQEAGYHFEVCYSFDAFQKIITRWLKDEIN